jgi:hypothetical protein
MHMQRVAVESEDFQIAVLTYRVEYKKKQLRSISSKISFNIFVLFFKNYIS